MGYGCSNLTEESFLGCSHKLSNEAAGVIVLPARHKLLNSSSPAGYAENCDESSMKLGKRRVLARRGCVGEKVSLFSILLT